MQSERVEELNGNLHPVGTVIDAGERRNGDQGLSCVSGVRRPAESTLLFLLASAFNRGRCVWDNLYAGKFPLLGKLSRHAFGDFFEVPPKVIVQRFFGLDCGHFDYLKFLGIGKS
jgi:hypothetical protein